MLHKGFQKIFEQRMVKKLSSSRSGENDLARCFVLSLAKQHFRSIVGEGYDEGMFTFEHMYLLCGSDSAPNFIGTRHIGNKNHTIKSIKEANVIVVVNKVCNMCIYICNIH